MVLSSLISDIIAILFIVIIIGGSLFYIIRAKKKGQKCIGCPYSKTCSSNKQNQCSQCSCENEK